MRLIGLLLVIVMSVGAGLFVLNLADKEKEEPKQVVVEVPKVVVEEVPTVDVVVARKDIAVGEVITPQHLDRQPWPSHLKLDDFIITDGQGDADLMGLVVRSQFKRGEPVIRTKLANPDDPNFLAASLDEGMRAVTIAVDVIAGVAGFVFPGDRVDIIVNHRVPMGPLDPNDPRSGQKAEMISEVLVQNVKVIAIDQRASSVGGEQPTVPRTVTVEASRQEAQRIRLAAEDGQLALALRSIHDKEAEDELPPPTGIADLSRVTPPSYFPVLYSTDSVYNPPVINLAEEEEAASSEGGAAAGGGVSQASGAATGGRSGVPGAFLGGKKGGPGLAGALHEASRAGLKTDVIVVRGTEQQVVGVSRP